MGYWTYLIVQFEILAFVAVALNLMVSAGLLHAGFAAFYGVGATAFAVLAMKHGYGFLGGAAGAALVAGSLSLIVAIPAWRFRRDAFVMVTVAAQVGIFAVLYNWRSMTGGPFGMYGIPKPDLFGAPITSPSSIALLYGALLGGLVLFAFLLMRSGFGRNLLAIRDDELAARSLGIPVERMKTLATVLATAAVGVAGAMYASFGRYIDPTMFTLDESILMLSAVIVGGSGRLIGPIVGAALLVALPEALRELEISSARVASLRILLYGLLLVVMMRVRPQGILGKYRLE